MSAFTSPVTLIKADEHYTVAYSYLFPCTYLFIATPIYFGRGSKIDYPDESLLFPLLVKQALAEVSSSFCHKTVSYLNSLCSSGEEESPRVQLYHPRNDILIESISTIANTLIQGTAEEIDGEKFDFAYRQAVEMGYRGETTFKAVGSFLKAYGIFYKYLKTVPYDSKPALTDKALPEKAVTSGWNSFKSPCALSLWINPSSPKRRQEPVIETLVRRALTKRNPKFLLFLVLSGLNPTFKDSVGEEEFEFFFEFISSFYQDYLFEIKNKQECEKLQHLFTSYRADKEPPERFRFSYGCYLSTLSSCIRVDLLKVIKSSNSRMQWEKIHRSLNANITRSTRSYRGNINLTFMRLF